MSEILIGARFENNAQEYIFKCFDAVAVGDMVVVDTRFGFKIVTVTSIPPETDKIPFDQIKEVVQVIDFAPFNARKERNEKIRALKKKMDRRVKELQDVAIYEMLAEKDPDLKELLDELKTLF